MDAALCQPRARAKQPGRLIRQQQKSPASFCWRGFLRLGWADSLFGETRSCSRRVLQRNKADNNHDPRDRLNAWPPLCELQSGQGRGPKTGRIVGCNRADDRCKSKALLTTCGESPYTVVRCHPHRIYPHQHLRLQFFYTTEKMFPLFPGCLSALRLQNHRSQFWPLALFQDLLFSPVLFFEIPPAI